MGWSAHDEQTTGTDPTKALLTTVKNLKPLYNVFGDGIRNLDTFLSI